MDLAEQLRHLKSQILQPQTGKQAFETWNALKSELSMEQRVHILTAWNKYLRTQNESSIIQAIEQIIREIK